MKENTKFLWIYVGILFSFALILIIFAGLSHNTDEEQRKGLQADVAALSEKNTALQAENTKLFKQVDELIANSDACTAKINMYNQVEAVLKEAYDLYRINRDAEAKELISQLDVSALSVSQKTVYDIIYKSK